MAKPVEFGRYPAELKHSTEQPEIVYHRSGELFAVHGESAESRPDPPVLTLTGAGGEPIQVYRGEPPPRSARAGSPAITPVYERSSRGVVVPTGRVFVRFRDGVEASRRVADVKGAGYRVTATLAYAPNALWLESGDGSMAAALANIAGLEALDDVVNVEPQLVALRSRR